MKVFKTSPSQNDEHNMFRLLSPCFYPLHKTVIC